MHFTHASKSPRPTELFVLTALREKRKKSTVHLQVDATKANGHNRYLTPTFHNEVDPTSGEIPSPLLAPGSKQLFQNPNGPEKILVTEPGETDNFLSTQRTHIAPLISESVDHNPLMEIGTLLDDDEEYALEDGNKTKLEYQKLQIMDLATTLIAFIGGFVTVLIVRE